MGKKGVGVNKTCFFILGSGRMGSTFLYNVLKEHPKVALTNEARIVDAIHLAYQAVMTPYGEWSEHGFQGLIRKDVQSGFVPIFLRHVKDAVAEYYAEAFGEDRTHWGDKLAGVAAAAEAGQIWPDTRYVVLVRDPRDVVCSYLHMQKIDDPQVLGPRWEEFMAMTPDGFAQQWADTYREILRLVPDHVLIRYEELMAHPQDAVASVLSHLGLHQDPAVDEAIRTGRSTQGHGTSATHQESVQRWKTDLTDDQAATIISICGPIAERLGLTLEAGS